MLFIEDGAPVIVQGMTGHQGMTHTASMLKAGTNIVGGVKPRKAGTSVTFPGAKNGADANIPVFATCGEAREATGAKASVVFVPPKFAKSAVVEAVEAGIELIVVITEGIPVADSAYFVELALKKGVRIIGPNCPGLITLGNPGVKVVDLGKDVKAEAIVEAAVAHKADLIGLSALMTTTMVRMRDTVDLVKQRGLGVDVMVGGAVVTPAFAESIGANYSSDAVDAVRLAKSLIAARKNQ